MFLDIGVLVGLDAPRGGVTLPFRADFEDDLMGGVRGERMGDSEENG